MNPSEYAADMLCGTALLITGYFAHSWFAWFAGVILIMLSVTHLDAAISLLIKALIEKLPFKNKP